VPFTRSNLVKDSIRLRFSDLELGSGGVEFVEACLAYHSIAVRSHLLHYCKDGVLFSLMGFY